MVATAKRREEQVVVNGRSCKPDGPLSVEGRNAVLAAWLTRYPTPVAFLLSKFPGLVRRALKLGFDLDDINAAALLGGVEAARLFDPARGVRFHSFAGIRMRQAVQRLCYRPEREAALRDGRHLGSLDHDPFGDDGGDTLGEVLADPRADDAAERDGGRSELAGRVAELLRSRLPCLRQRRVVELRWGLDGTGGRTLREVARLFRVSKARIGQIEKKVREKIGPELLALYREFCSPF